MSRTRIALGLCALVIVSLAATSVHYFQQAANGQRLFAQVAGEIDRRFVDSIGANGIFEKAATGLVEQLHDPYSALLPPVEVTNFERNVGGRYGGIGAVVETRTGNRTFIQKVYTNTPAERGGVIAGDEIIAVDGVTTVGWEMSKVTERTRGDVGTKVKVTFRREGVAKPFVLEMTRAIVHIPAVPYAFQIEPGIGYIPMQTFSATSADEVRTSVARLRKEGAKSFILDLRGNPGGLLQEALELSSLFLKTGQPVLTVRGRNGAVQSDSALGPRLEEQLPLIVLSDEGSASASEIVAGALQDHDRALIIGARSYGKGLVQQTMPLDGGYLLKLTTGKWYTPNGRSIHRDRTMQADGRMVEKIDSTKKLPEFKSDMGRTLLGGGGIMPDITIAQDTISSLEQEFLRLTAPQAGLIVTTLIDEAEKLKKTVKQDFVVQPEWLSEVNRKLDSAGVKIDERLKPARQSVLTRELGRHLSRKAFGDSAQARREIPDDNQLMRAVALLRGKTTQQAVFAAAK